MFLCFYAAALWFLRRFFGFFSSHNLVSTSRCAWFLGCFFPTRQQPISVKTMASASSSLTAFSP